MSWKAALIAGVALLGGCDFRSEREVVSTMWLHINDRCKSSGMAQVRALLGENAKVHPVYYCSCLSSGLTEGKSRAEVLEMEQNPASYLEPPESLVRQCAETSRA